MSIEVSVIVPTYNRAQALEKALNSIISQSVKLEVLVCDDGSTDNTAAVAERAATRCRLKYIRGSNSGGPARPRNAGLQTAQGEFVAFLDSDDWWEPNKLSASVEALRLHKVDCVYHDLYIQTQQGAGGIRKVARSRRLASNAFSDMLLNGNAINTSSVVARAAVLRRAGYFDETREVVGFEDYDEWLRMARVGCRFEKLPQVLGHYWVGNDNLTGRRTTIRCSKYMYKKYRELVDPQMRRKYAGSVQYVLGRCYSEIGEHRKASKYLKNAILLPSKPSTRWKALIALLLLRMRIRDAGVWN